MAEKVRECDLTANATANGVLFGAQGPLNNVSISYLISWFFAHLVLTKQVEEQIIAGSLMALLLKRS